MFCFFAIVYGFAFGGFDILVTALIGDIFGVHSLGAIIGIFSVGWGIGAAIGPTVAGLIFDVTGKYFMAFIIGAAAMVVTTFFVGITKHRASKK